MYKTKLECAKYLKDKYGKKIEILLLEKKQEKYKAGSLDLIRKEYEMFFNDMRKHLENNSNEKEILETVEQFKVLLDFIYVHGSDILRAYIDLFINNKEYNDMLTNLNKKLPSYIVKYIKVYLKDN